MPPKKRTKKNPEIKPSSLKNKESTNIEKYSLKQKKLLNEIYGMPMPENLFHFWDFCLQIDKKSPLEVFSCMGLRLVGPFEVLAGKIKKENVSNPISYHLHWRFFFDPPEFMTLMVSIDSSSLYHLGYLRDDPGDERCVVTSSNGEDCKLNVLGDNLFASVAHEIKNKMTSARGKQKNLLQNHFDKLNAYAEAHDVEMIVSSEVVKKRKKLVVANTFHSAGIVVTIDENDVGYRPLHFPDNKLRKIFLRIDQAKNDEERMEAFDEIQEMMTCIEFANDELDYGMGLELGIDMFCFGSR